MCRRLVIPAIVVLAVLAGLAIVVLRPAPVPPAAPLPALPALRAQIGAADRIEFTRGDKLLWLERRGQVWGLSQEGGYPVRPAQAAALVDGLLSLRLDHPVVGDSNSLGVADPGAQPGGGTLVRIFATSGSVLGAIIVSTGPGPIYVRQPGLPQIWHAGQPLPAGTDPADWMDRHLQPPNLEGADTAPMRSALANLTITQVRAAPQIHLEHLQTVALTLADGTALLTLGQANSQDWLRISGSSAWARSLSPYAFAVSAGAIPGLMP